MPQCVLFLITLFWVFWSVCSGCLWDYDTLAMERQRFPKAHELIAGYFVRHSPAYYAWRIKDRTSKPNSQRTPSDYDDIAVAYDKLGNHEKAIETIKEKLERWPEALRYESQANLGTFYIHAGRYEEGLTHVRNALTINPEAHFGREVYQQLLVEYLLESQQQGQNLPLSDLGDGGFAQFVLAKREPFYDDPRSEITAAAKGIMGMMRFGDHSSPVLLEALGDLLIHDYSDDSKMLAARAYLQAAKQVDDPAVKQAYRTKAECVMEMQRRVSFAGVESALQSEIELGDELFRKISADEKSWASSGENLDENFAREYYNDPEFEIREPLVRSGGLASLIVFAFVAIAGMAVAYMIVARKKALGA